MRFLMSKVYLEDFFFLDDLRADGDAFFFLPLLVEREAARATDLSAFSVILVSQASISEFSDGVATVTLGLFGFLFNLILGKPLA